MNKDKNVDMQTLEILVGMQGKEVEVDDDWIRFKFESEDGTIYDDLSCVNSELGMATALNAFTARNLR